MKNTKFTFLFIIFIVVSLPTIALAECDFHKIKFGSSINDNANKFP